MGFWFFRCKKSNIHKAGFAARVIFYYPGEDGTYLDGAWVQIYDSGVVDISHPREQVTTHIQNVEIVWQNNRQSKGERAFVLHSFQHVNKNSPASEEIPKE